MVDSSDVVIQVGSRNACGPAKWHFQVLMPCVLLSWLEKGSHACGYEYHCQCYLSRLCVWRCRSWMQEILWGPAVATLSTILKRMPHTSTCCCSSTNVTWYAL